MINEILAVVLAAFFLLNLYTYLLFARNNKLLQFRQKAISPNRLMFAAVIGAPAALLARTSFIRTWNHHISLPLLIGLSIIQIAIFLLCLLERLKITNFIEVGHVVH